MARNVGAHVWEHGSGPCREDRHQAGVGWKGEDQAPVSEIQLQPRVRDPAPVREVPAGERGLLLVHRRPDGASETGIAPVGADGHRRMLGHQRPAGGFPAPNPDDPLTVADVVLHREPGAKVRPGLDCRVEQDLVDRAPARAVSERRAVHHDVPVAQGKVAVVADDRGDRRRARRRHSVQQPPALQPRGPATMQEMAVGEIAGEGRPIHQKDPVTSPGEEHRGGGAGAPRADDDGVVHESGLHSLAANGATVAPDRVAENRDPSGHLTREAGVRRAGTGRWVRRRAGHRTRGAALGQLAAHLEADAAIPAGDERD